MSTARSLGTPSWREPLLALVIAMVVVLAFWKIYLIDQAEPGGPTALNVDLYIEHYPMARYGFEELREGHLPLWNPYELAGMPFMAVPYVGLFYPPNLPSLVFGAAIGTEISLILHLCWAVFGFWWLARTLGIRAVGAAGGALTFLFSGWMIYRLHVPVLMIGMSWLPVTLLCVEWVVRRRRFGALALGGAVTAQLLAGATEVLVQNLLAAGLYGSFRLVELAVGGRRDDAVRAAGALVAAVCGGVALAGFQLFPSLELASLSARVKDPLPAHFRGSIFPYTVVSYATHLLNADGLARVGTLSLLGLGLGFGVARLRGLWLYALVLLALTAALVLVPPLATLYYASPFGRSFRDPQKFLHLSAFAHGLIAALALSRLDGWRRERAARGNVWRDAGWWASLAGLAGLLAVVGFVLPGTELLASLPLLLLFGVARSSAARGAALAGLVALHAAALVPHGPHSNARLGAQPEIFDEDEALYEELAARVGDSRVYLSPELVWNASRTLKQGMIRRLELTQGYQPLGTALAASYFNAAALEKELHRPIFTGWTKLGKGSAFALMDLTATRYYVVPGGEPIHLALMQLERSSGGKQFRQAFAHSNLVVYERPQSLPRVRWVSGGRVIAYGERLLWRLANRRVDPRHEVLFSEGTARPASDAKGTAHLVLHEPEEVRIIAEADAPGYVVLADAWYPGWEATVNGEAVPIRRADYLFRAVEVPAGRSEIRFVYRPRSLAWGALVSAAAAVAFLVVAWRGVRRGRAPLFRPPS